MPLLRATLPEPAGVFPWSLPLLRHTRDLAFSPTVTVLVGENGSGKSTLLEAIALAAELPTAGSHDLHDDPTLDRLRPFAAEREAVHLHAGERRRRVAPFLGPVGAADARYGGDLDARSHGESFLASFQTRLRGPGLYLLDEPEAALSPIRQLALVALLGEAVGRGAQFVIATRAPILMA